MSEVSVFRASLTSLIFLKHIPFSELLLLLATSREVSLARFSMQTLNAFLPDSFPPITIESEDVCK